MNQQNNNQVHPICTHSPDQSKCAEFVERLEAAQNNIQIREGGGLKRAAQQRQS